MAPKKRPNKKNNNSLTDPTPPPPPQFDPAMFQAAVTAAVTAALSQINPGGAGGSGSGIHSQNHEGRQRHQKECSYKDIMNAKPMSFDDN